MWWHHDWTGWNWLFMTLSMVLFWGVIIGGIVWAIRSTGTQPAPPRERSARELLDERFARGEITEDEYRRARDTLAGR